MNREKLRELQRQIIVVHSTLNKMLNGSEDHVNEAYHNIITVPLKAIVALTENIEAEVALEGSHEETQEITETR